MRALVAVSFGDARNGNTGMYARHNANGAKNGETQKNQETAQERCFHISVTRGTYRR